MTYQPRPIDTSKVSLSSAIRDLVERLAENAHDQGALQRMGEGWRFGSARNDERKEHPCLVSYADLPESEKDYDRRVATETLRAILALGYPIEPPNTLPPTSSFTVRTGSDLRSPNIRIPASTSAASDSTAACRAWASGWTGAVTGGAGEFASTSAAPSGRSAAAARGHGEPEHDERNPDQQYGFAHSRIYIARCRREGNALLVQVRPWR